MLTLNPDALTPIYLQIAAWLEDQILADELPADERIYSQYQLAELFNINPATAAKGLNVLAEQGIVYKKRGLGMFVSPEAKSAILQKRRSGKLQQLVADLVLEARQLSIEDDELIHLIQNEMKKEV